jgi:hypothetical protein
VNEHYVHRNGVPGHVLVELDELVRDDGAWSVWGEEFAELGDRKKTVAARRRRFGRVRREHADEIAAGAGEIGGEL